MIGSFESILREDDGTTLKQLLFVKMEEKFRFIISQIMKVGVEIQKSKSLYL